MSTEDKYDYKYDSIAVKNLSDIFEYIRFKLCNPKAAKDLFDNITEAVEQVRRFPESGETRYEDIRRILVDNYWLYYIPLHDIKTIYIVKLTHATQKYENEKFD